LSAKCPHWLNPLPPPPCPCGHTINFKKSEVFYTKKCRRPHLKKAPWSALDTPPDCGRLLWTAAKHDKFSCDTVPKIMMFRKWKFQKLSSKLTFHRFEFYGRTAVLLGRASEMKMLQRRIPDLLQKDTLASIAVGEQSSLGVGSTMNLLECSNQNISNILIFFPFFS